jgi:hypothetical protein
MVAWYYESSIPSLACCSISLIFFFFGLCVKYLVELDLSLFDYVFGRV